MKYAHICAACIAPTHSALLRSTSGAHLGVKRPAPTRSALLRSSSLRAFSGQAANPNSLGPTSLDLWCAFGGQAAHPNSLGPTSLENPARILGSSKRVQSSRRRFRVMAELRSKRGQKHRCRDTAPRVPQSTYSHTHKQATRHPETNPHPEPPQAPPKAHTNGIGIGRWQ